jgi:ankyrin repeat protein
LSKDESEKLFKEIDVDGSNTITPDELRHYLLSGESNKTFEIQEKILEESELDVSTIAKQMLFSRFFRHYMNDPKSIKPSELENESQFLFAIQKGSLDYIKSALKTNPYLKNAMSADQRASAMHVAIEFKQYEIMTLLLDMKADLAMCDCNGEAAVHKASRSGDIKALEMLLSFDKSLLKQRNFLVGTSSC